MGAAVAEAESEVRRLIGGGEDAPRRYQPRPLTFRAAGQHHPVYAAEEMTGPPAPPLLDRMRGWLRSVLDRRDRERKKRQIARECLEHYNAMHPGSEFQLAPGEVTRYMAVAVHNHAGTWIHGNFLARRRSTGYFSFIPAPRTLFFYEVGFHGFVTCIPLDDEPVDEAYSFLCFRLGWGKRRSGKLDCVCQTCGHRLAVPYPFPIKTFACGHREVDRLCEMCYLRYPVIHPSPAKFQCGHQKNCKFCYLDCCL